MKPPLLILFAGILITACKKEQVDALPKATQEGKNTFGCLIDGQAFLPQKSQALILQPQPDEPLFTWYLKRQFDVLATGNGRKVFIRITGVVRAGTYTLVDARPGESYGSCRIGSAEYFTNVAASGQVIISRFDSVAKIAAGTFQFTALDYQSGKTLTIADGRFDVRLP
jgi:hypothetical protein